VTRSLVADAEDNGKHPGRPERQLGPASATSSRPDGPSELYGEMRATEKVHEIPERLLIMRETQACRLALAIDAGRIA